MKIRRFDRVGEEGPRGRTGQRPIGEELRRSRRRWYGHVLRTPDQRIHKQAITGDQMDGGKLTDLKIHA